MKQDLHEKRNLALRLSGYAASAGALLAMGSVANSQVVYSGIQNIQMFMPSDFHEIDMDGDMISDFGFIIGGYSDYSTFTYAGGTYHAWYGYGWAEMFNARTDGYLNSWITRMTTITSYSGPYSSYTNFNYYPILNGLGGGVMVDSAQTMWSNLTYAYYPGAFGIGYLYSITGPYYSYYYAVGYGDFFGDERYVGVRFYIGTEQHYGWIRVSLGEYIDPVTIIDWAYEGTAGTGILTGAGDNAGPNAIFDAGLAETLYDTVSVDLSFDERAYAFDQTDIEVINGSVSDFEEIAPGLRYRMLVTADNPGEVVIMLPEASVYDQLGNANVQAATSWIYNHIDAVNSLSQDGIKVYPNPVNSDLHIELAEPAEIKIISLNGNVLFMKKDIENDVIDVSSYVPGVYIIQILNSAGITQHKLVIK